MKKGLIAFGLASIMCFSIGAATGVSIQANLVNQQIVCHDTNYSKQVPLHLILTLIQRPSASKK